DVITIWRNFKKLLERLESNASSRKEAIERLTRNWPRRRLFGFWSPRSETTLETDEKSTMWGTDSKALEICHYAVYVVSQIQRIGWSIGLAFFALIAILATYRLQAPQLVGRFLAVLFVIIGGIVIWVFGGMERNWTISRISRSEPGQLGLQFWAQAGAVG